MSLRAKRNLIAALIAVLLVWPLAHRVLVVRYGITPWRFFGWAMYCTPKLPVMVAIHAVSNDTRARLAVTGVGDQALRYAVRGFSRRRAVWGSLAEPNGVGALALAKHPDADRIEIEVEQLFLNPDTARIDSRKTTYTYDRAP